MNRQNAAPRKPVFDEVNLRATALNMARESGVRQGWFGRVRTESAEEHVARAQMYYDFLTTTQEERHGDA